MDISFERNMLIVERFIASLINKYRKRHISTDGGSWCPKHFTLKLKPHAHSPLEKNIIERTIQYLKDRPII
jgi:putative transposase